MADEMGTKSKSLRRCSYAGSCFTSEEKSRRISVAVNPLEESRLSSSSSSNNTTAAVSNMHPTSFQSYNHHLVSSRSGSSHHRRVSRANEDGFNCSQQSILSAMDRFVKTVHNMNSTVLVPSKLRDMDITGTKMRDIPPALANTDLYNFYQMLNEVKKELLWGPGTAAATLASIIHTQDGSGSARTPVRELKHVRQPSDDSLGSLGSTASSSDPETDSDVDSMVNDRDSVDEHTSHLAAAFRHHLQGLHTILHQLADSADYLSSRYQEDVDDTCL